MSVKNMPNKLHLIQRVVCSLNCVWSQYKYYLQLHHMQEYKEKNRFLALIVVSKEFNSLCNFLGTV